MLVRLAMAVQAPAHRERFLLNHRRHGGHVPVAVRAPDPTAGVHAMVEVGEIGKVVHAVPGDRLTREPRAPQRLDLGRIVPDLGMTPHAKRRRGHARDGVFIGLMMTIETVDLVIDDVVPMVEVHRLWNDFVLLGDVRGPNIDH